MKTQIIQLEAYDDTVSVRDKMGWGQTSRILLIWPGQGQLLQRRLDLVLLLRHSLSLGAQLGLVTHDSQVRANAQGLNIPVFNNLRQAQTGRWRVGRRKRPRLWRTGPRADLRELRPSHMPSRLDHPLAQRSLFALSILAILALAAAIVPGAWIEVQVPVSTQELTIPVTASEEASSVSLAGITPARWDTIVVEGRERITSTGTIEVPEKPATGSVRFTNLTQNRVPVPAGTIVSTLEEPVIRFMTTKEGTVPAGIGQSASVEVQAVVPGKTSNLGAGDLQAIEGPLGLQLSAINPNSTRGGTSLSSAAPAPGDRKKVYDSLLKSLQQAAQKELLDGWKSAPLSASFPITSTLSLMNTREMIYTPEENLPAEELELTLRLEFNILVVDGKDLERLVTPLLNASLEPNQQAVPGTLTLETASSIDLTGNGQHRWRLTARRQVESILTEDLVAATASKLKSGQAAQNLVERLELKTMPQIRLWPEWWPFLPAWPARIDVSFK